jgi:hypothetical protein
MTIGLAKVTTLAAGDSVKVRTTVYLVHSTPGLEIAGSGTRPVNEYWAVRYTRDNATHGARYKTQHEAEAHFYRLMDM